MSIIVVCGENIATIQARIMYNSYHLVGFGKVARLGHWMSSLGIHGIGEGVKRFL